MKKPTLLILIALLAVSASNLNAEENEKIAEIEFYGFINHEVIFDTRQVVSAREGLVLLFPMDEKLDEDGNDINATPNFNFIAFSSRFGARLKGPDAFGAKTSGLIEGDLIGIGPGFNSLARLRHAFINFSWENAELLAGQFWHPLFVGACFPATVSFAGVVPYHVLNRSPQLRFSYNFQHISLSATLLAHNDFASLGPDGTSSDYLRNSKTPEAYIQAIIKNNSFFVGATAGYQSIKPRKETTAGYKTNETMESLHANIFSNVKLPFINIKMQANYSENSSHLIMPGGYGEAERIDPQKEIYSYTGIQYLTSWADFETNTSDRVVAGLLFGYATNLGANEDITGEVYARGANIAYMYRIAPRIIFNSGKAQIGAEVMYNVAAYGTPDKRFNISDTKEVSNLRTVASIKYFF